MSDINVEIVENATLNQEIEVSEYCGPIYIVKGSDGLWSYQFQKPLNLDLSDDAWEVVYDVDEAFDIVCRKNKNLGE